MRDEFKAASEYGSTAGDGHESACMQYCAFMHSFEDESLPGSEQAIGDLRSGLFSTFPVTETKILDLETCGYMFTSTALHSGGP